MNLVGEKIDIQEIIRTSRDFSCKQFIDFFQRHGRPFWCWGSTAWTDLRGRGMRFAVTGLKHRGHVYIRCNGADTLDVYLTTLKGTIKDTIEGVYIDQVFELMHEKIEGE